MKGEAKTKQVVVTEDSVVVDGVTLRTVTSVKIDVAARQVPWVHITLAAPSSRGGVHFAGDAYVSQSIEKRSDVIADQPSPMDRPDIAPAWDGVIQDFRSRHDYVLTRDCDLPDAAVALLVLDDMAARDRVGRERYGTPLTALNGRDQLVDAYQELLDASAYLRAAKDEGIDVGHAYGRVLDSLLEIRTKIHARRVPA